MSSEQWAAIMRGDESYAGARSWFRFEERAAGADRLPPHHPHPPGAGGGADPLLVPGRARGRSSSATPTSTRPGPTSSTWAPTAMDLPVPEALRPRSDHPFKGNIDLGAAGAGPRRAAGAQVACVIVTMTNNSGGGQPVSMANIRAASADRAARHGIPFYLDACRFAENAYFIKLREAGYAGPRSVRVDRPGDVLPRRRVHDQRQEGRAWSTSAGSWPSNDDDLARQEQNLLILTEGFPTYGGLAGRDLDAIAVGLREVVDEDYLRYRLALRRATWGRGSSSAAIPIVQPPGGHAIYIDAGALPAPHPARASSRARRWRARLYLEGGIRGVEIGSAHVRREGPGGPARSASPRWSWCGWPSRGGSTPRATSTTCWRWPRRSSRSGAAICAACGSSRSRRTSGTSPRGWPRSAPEAEGASGEVVPGVQEVDLALGEAEVGGRERPPPRPRRRSSPRPRGPRPREELVHGEGLGAELPGAAQELPVVGDHGHRRRGVPRGGAGGRGSPRRPSPRRSATRRPVLAPWPARSAPARCRRRGARAPPRRDAAAERLGPVDEEPAGSSRSSGTAWKRRYIAL